MQRFKRYDQYYVESDCNVKGVLGTNQAQADMLVPAQQQASRLSFSVLAWIAGCRVRRACGHG